MPNTDWHQLDHSTQEAAIQWLLRGDPAIVHQTLRDILHAPVEACDEVRTQIATLGWGADLLHQRNPMDHTWSGKMYSPKWTSTHYTLLLLKNLEIQPLPEIVDSCLLLLKNGFWKDGGINFWSTLKHSEICISGMVLGILSFFEVKDERTDALLNFLLDNQMPDGGWNCEVFKGATHSSFHTTLSVMEGLWEYQLHEKNRSKEILQAHKRAAGFICDHRLFQSHRTGKIVDPKMVRFTFPTYWRYDILRMLDHFRLCKYPPTEAMQDAVDILQSKMSFQGEWKLASPYSGRTFFSFEKVGQPSRWITLKSIRVLNWWNQPLRDDEMRGDGRLN